MQKMARHQTPQIEIFFLNIAGDPIINFIIITIVVIINFLIIACMALFSLICFTMIFIIKSLVRRDHLVTDSLKEISSKQKDLKKKLKVRNKTMVIDSIAVPVFAVWLNLTNTVSE